MEVRCGTLASMPCPRCGCRLISKTPGPPPALVCCDCGQPMDLARRDEQRSLGWGDFGSVALVLGTLILALGLVSLLDQLGAVRSPLEQRSPGAAPVSAHQQPHPHRQPQRAPASRRTPLTDDAL